MSQFPLTTSVSVQFKRPSVQNIPEEIRKVYSVHSGSFGSLQGLRVAVAVGSRGIANLSEIVKTVVSQLKQSGAQPFVVPAMGSHGGGTPEGQKAVLGKYQVTEERVGAPIESSIATVDLGKDSLGIPVRIDEKAFNADRIVLINRVKPHTDFSGDIGSGLLKMIAVGLGNVEGAIDFHTAVQTHPYEKVILSKAERLIKEGKVLFGVGIVENAYHETAHIDLIKGGELMESEPELLRKAKLLMPSLPVDQLDIVIVEKIGKNISGTGMDPNITGRWFEGSSIWQEKPSIRRIIVLSLSEETQGNGLGLGLADFCSRRAVEQMDREVTYKNVITSQNLVNAHIPMFFSSDVEVLTRAIDSLGVRKDPEEIKLIRIRDTLSLSLLEASTAVVQELENHPDVSGISMPRPMEFDSAGNFFPLHKGDKS